MAAAYLIHFPLSMDGKMRHAIMEEFDELSWETFPHLDPGYVHIPGLKRSGLITQNLFFPMFLQNVPLQRNNPHQDEIKVCIIVNYDAGFPRIKRTL